ncbi:hypothetical protein D3C73_549900 [compost metagenome]
MKCSLHRGMPFNNLAGNILMNRLCRDIQRDFQHILTLAPVNGQDTMRRHFLGQLPVAVVHFIDRFLFSILRCRINHAMIKGISAYPGPNRSIIRNNFSHNIHGSLHGFLWRFHSLIGADITRGFSKKVTLLRLG